MGFPTLHGFLINEVNDDCVEYAFVMYSVENPVHKETIMALTEKVFDQELDDTCHASAFSNPRFVRANGLRPIGGSVRHKIMRAMRNYCTNTAFYDMLNL